MGEDHHDEKAMKENSLQLCLISVIRGCSQIASDRKTIRPGRSQAETICGVVEPLCLFIPWSPGASGNHQTKRNTGKVMCSLLNLVAYILALQISTEEVRLWLAHIKEKYPGFSWTKSLLKNCPQVASLHNLPAMQISWKHALLAHRMQYVLMQILLRLQRNCKIILVCYKDYRGCLQKDFSTGCRKYSRPYEERWQLVCKLGNWRVMSQETSPNPFGNLPSCIWIRELSWFC